uniref:Uncharacterized protein n=1 Tax=Arundo donax TaxID=35708 RepID=A0A0A8ZRR2_ARUDO
MEKSPPACSLMPHHLLQSFQFPSFHGESQSINKGKFGIRGMNGCMGNVVRPVK